MKYVFWQNMVSPHQSFFFRLLASTHDVTLIVEIDVEVERREQGWDLPDTGKTKLLLFSADLNIDDIISDHDNTVHFFSGINSYPKISKVFKRIISTHRVGIVVESPIQIGLKFYLTKLLYKYYCYRFGAKIKYLFAMGRLGVDFYKSVGFKQASIHKFQYFTEPPQQVFGSPNEESINFFFIGQLIPRKGLISLFLALSKFTSYNWKLHIIGAGVQKDELLGYAKKNSLSSHLIFYGTLNNLEAMRLLQEKADYLILPSKFDGWGAVITEALSRGIKVITNNKCGACCLVTELNWGYVYNEGSVNGLNDTFAKVFSEYNKTSEFEKSRIINEYRENYTYKGVNKFIKITNSTNE